MSFNINKKLIFIDSFQLLNMNKSLVKNMNKSDFKCLSQEFGSKVLDLVKQKGSYPYQCMSDFESLMMNCQAKKNFILR